MAKNSRTRSKGEIPQGKLTGTDPVFPICLACNGTGKTKDGKWYCENCEGWGYLKTERANYNDRKTTW